MIQVIWRLFVCGVFFLCMILLCSLKILLRIDIPVYTLIIVMYPLGILLAFIYDVIHMLSGMVSDCILKRTYLSYVKSKVDVLFDMYPECAPTNYCARSVLFITKIDIEEQERKMHEDSKKRKEANRRRAIRGALSAVVWVLCIIGIFKMML